VWRGQGEGLKGKSSVGFKGQTCGGGKFAWMPGDMGLHLSMRRGILGRAMDRTSGLTGVSEQPQPAYACCCGAVSPGWLVALLQQMHD
jgi:hypothetical protein